MQSDDQTAFVGPPTRVEYEQIHKRPDKPDLLADLEAEQLEDVEFERLDEREATEAGAKAWKPSAPPFIDSHFSVWTTSASLSQSQLYLGGRIPPPPADNDSQLASRLRRDFTMDDYEEELLYVRKRSELEASYEVGELAPIRYAIHCQVASTYSESMMLSSMAEEYYCMAGYIGWCDLTDPGLHDHIVKMSGDPLLVGLRYDVSQFDGDFLLDSYVDSNFTEIENSGLPFDLAIGPHQLAHACHVAYRHPRLRLVLNHCGLPIDLTALPSSTSNKNPLVVTSWRSDLEYLSRYQNVSCKVTGASGCLPSSSSEASALETLTHTIRQFGPDRCIYGSGWPLCRLIEPGQSGWPDHARLATASNVDQPGDIPGELRTKLQRGRSVPLDTLNVWETCRLVERALEDAGYGALGDKYKVFSTNAQSLYRLTIRPYGSVTQFRATS